MMNLIIIEAICLFFSMIYSGMETGLLAADKLKIHSKKQEGKLWAYSVDFLLRKPERLLATVLIGNNIAVVTGAVMLNNYLRTNYSLSIAMAGSMGLTFFYLLMGEILPKTFFRRYADSITVRMSFFIHLCFFIFFPLSLLLNAIVGALMFITGQRGSGDKLPRSRDDFRQLMHLSSREAGFGYDDYRTIDDILDFGDTIASEAMIPIHKYPVFHVSSKPADIIRIAEQTGQRYFPCYAQRTDNIVGFVDIQDFSQPGKDLVSEILRPPVFFPEVKPLPGLLDTMVDNEYEVVFLVDEYGAVSGIVTHQEIASEIIGVIPGNKHTVKEDIIWLGDNSYIATGDCDLEYFTHVTEVVLDKNNNETLGGYLCEKTGMIPEVGTVYQEGKATFTVLDGDSRTISRIKVEIEEDEEE